MVKLLNNKNDISIPYDGRFDDTKIIYCCDNDDFEIIKSKNGETTPDPDNFVNQINFIVIPYLSNENNILYKVLFIRYDYNYKITPCIYNSETNNLYVWKNGYYPSHYDNSHFSIANENLLSCDGKEIKKGDLIFSFYEDRCIHIKKKYREYCNIRVSNNFSGDDIIENDDTSVTFKDINGNIVNGPPREITIYSSLSKYFSEILEYINSL